MDTDLDTTLSADRPLLFVDVDGVLSLFGLHPSREDAGGPLHWIDGMPHLIPAGAGQRLLRLAERFDLVWASGWEERANEHLPFILGLPFGPVPFLTFGGRAVFGSSDWKLDAVDAYAGERPAAWIDDNLDDESRFWAEGRRAPTLLVETQCDVGMTEAHVELLLAWADDVAGSSPSEGVDSIRAA